MDHDDDGYPLPRRTGLHRDVERILERGVLAIAESGVMERAVPELRRTMARALDKMADLSGISEARVLRAAARLVRGRDMHESSGKIAARAELRAAASAIEQHLGYGAIHQIDFVNESVIVRMKDSRHCRGSNLYEALRMAMEDRE